MLLVYAHKVGEQIIAVSVNKEGLREQIRGVFTEWVSFEPPKHLIKIRYYSFLIEGGGQLWITLVTWAIGHLRFTALGKNLKTNKNKEKYQKPIRTSVIQS